MTDIDEDQQPSSKSSTSELIDEISCTPPKENEICSDEEDQPPVRSSQDLAKYYQRKRMRQLEAVYGQDDDI